MPNRTIHTDQAPAAIGPYSQGVIANGFLFTAGQIALDPATGEIVQGDVVAQAERVFENIGRVLAAAGSGPEHVVKVTLFLTDVDDRSAINPVRQRWFGETRPASTLVEVSRLAIPGAKIEVEAVAIVPA